MILSEDLAKKIVEKTIEATHFHINVMNKMGVIISSSDPNRIQQFHEGAFQVIKTGKEMSFTPEDSKQLTGTKPGINMPIFFRQEVVGVIGITGEPKEVIPYAKAIRLMTEMILHEAYLLEQINMEERAKDHLVNDLISGNLSKSLDDILTRGELLNINLSVPRSIMLIQVHGDVNAIKKIDSSIYRFQELTLLFSEPKQVLLSQIKPNLWAIVTIIADNKTNEQKKECLYRYANQMHRMIRSWSNVTVKVTMGNVYDDPLLLEDSFMEAWNALKILTKFPDQGDVMHIDDLGLELILLEMKDITSDRIIRQTFGNLLSEPEMFHTLQAFFANNLNVTTTAQVMNLHRNSLLYRLERIEESTGLNPKNFKQAVQMYIAIQLLNTNKTFTNINENVKVYKK